MWIVIKSLWWLWAIVLVIALVPILGEMFFQWIDRWLEKRRLKKHKTLMEWKKLDPQKFEKITAIIFEKLGYKTKIVGGPGDWGVDIIAHKNGERIFIQCKKMDKVAPGAIREFWGSIEGQIKRGEGEKGFLVTTGNFTKESREFVKDKPIELVDGLKLEKLAKS